MIITMSTGEKYYVDIADYKAFDLILEAEQNKSFEVKLVKDLKMLDQPQRVVTLFSRHVVSIE